MVMYGHVRNGVVVLDDGEHLPEGAPVRVEFLKPGPAQTPRVGGVWRGQVQLADDFDELPQEIAEAFGMPPS